MPEQYLITGRGAEAIARSIEEGIVSGRLAPLELLPSVRELATRLGVSAGTVAAGYRLAGQRGLTTADRRRGTRVRPAREAALSGAVSPEPALPGVVDLSNGGPDPTLLPDLPRAVAELDYRPVGYGAACLAAPLGEVAARQLSAAGVAHGRLTCTFGALDAITRVLSANLRPGDRVAVEDPGWPALIDALPALGLAAVPLSLDGCGVEPDSLWAALAGGARAVVLTSRAQNPTGAVMSPERAGELRRVLERYPGVTALEDDHGHAITTAPLSPLLASSDPPGGPWAHVRSAAKGYGPDLRLAVVVGDEATVGRLEAGLAAGPGWVSHLLQQAVARLWSDPAVDALVAEAARSYDLRRQSLLSELASRGIEARGESGLNVWVPTGDEAGTLARLLEAGFRAAAGASFRITSPPATRLTTAALRPEQAGELAEVLSSALNQAGGGRY